MPKPERPAVEQQALAAELLAEDAVVLALSVGRIARQVVADEREALGAEASKLAAEVITGDAAGIGDYAAAGQIPPVDGLGCGPGHTTALLAEVLQCRRTVGLDLSAEFIERARGRASDRIAFHVHDVTVVPFPEGPADLVYCRLLLSHLSDPMAIISRWATQLLPGGLLMLDEVESIATSSPALQRYLEILDQMLRSQLSIRETGNRIDCANHVPRTSAHFRRRLR